jgi:hypothetical protein
MKRETDSEGHIGTVKEICQIVKRGVRLAVFNLRYEFGSQDCIHPFMK